MRIVSLTAAGPTPLTDPLTPFSPSGVEVSTALPIVYNFWRGPFLLKSETFPMSLLIHVHDDLAQRLHAEAKNRRVSVEELA